MPKWDKFVWRNEELDPSNWPSEAHLDNINVIYWHGVYNGREYAGYIPITPQILDDLKLDADAFVQEQVWRIVEKVVEQEEG